MGHRGWLALLLVVAGLGPAAGPARAQEPILTETDCSVLVVFGTDLRPGLGEIACGTLIVPENRLVPEGRHIELSYVVLRATGPAAVPDPLVYLEGGPGGSALLRTGSYARLFASLRRDRDVVLFDQRGTGRSSPLECARFSSFDDLFGAFGGGADPVALPSTSNTAAFLAEVRANVLPATAACARELSASGVDLSQYNSASSAADVVDLVRALGYDRYNLYGISYGTRLALTIMRDHPRSGLRSVVLDSTYPPNLPGYEQTAALPHEVALQFFADCALDPACGAAYPDLKNRFVALMDRLRTDPIVAPDGTSVSATDVAEVMRSIANQVRVVPYLPRMIAELEQGQTDTYRGIVSGELVAVPLAPEPAAENPVAPAPAERQAGEATPPAVAAAVPSSPAREWLGDAQRRVQTLPGDFAAATLQLLLLLDHLPRERATLEEFVARAFTGDERAEDRAALLALIAAMTEEDVQEVFVIIDDAPDLLDAESAGTNGAMFNSVECHEAIRFESFADAAAVAEDLEIPELGAPLEVVAGQFVRCEVWPAGTAPDVEFEAVTSEVPTLIMAGAYDAQTPVSWNKLVFLSLPNAYWSFFPMSGHGTIFYSACAGEVGAGFLDRPDRLPDLSCTADLEPVFVLPDDAAPATPPPPAEG